MAYLFFIRGYQSNLRHLRSIVLIAEYTGYL